jgi:hypothetical protein
MDDVVQQLTIHKEHYMNRIASSFVTTLALVFLSTTGCSKGGNQCEQVVAHVNEITKAQMPDEAKAKAVAKCEKQPEAAQQCALKASSIEELMACK